MAANCGPGDLEILVRSYNAQDPEGGSRLGGVGSCQPFSEIAGSITIRIGIWVSAGGAAKILIFPPIGQTIGVGIHDALKIEASSGSHFALESWYDIHI